MSSDRVPRLEELQLVRSFAFRRSPNAVSADHEHMVPARYYERWGEDFTLSWSRP
ncbi:MAG: hypothetical protein ABSG53_08310 [Thermoguttaceae bacterium]